MNENNKAIIENFNLTGFKRTGYQIQNVTDYIKSTEGMTKEDRKYVLEGVAGLIGQEYKNLVTSEANNQTAQIRCINAISRLENMAANNSTYLPVEQSMVYRKNNPELFTQVGSTYQKKTGISLN